jgi:hypothetical protein
MSTTKVLIGNCARAQIRHTAVGYVFVDFGELVPDGCDQADLDRLLGEGFLREGTLEEVGGIVAPTGVAGGEVPGQDGDVAPAAVDKSSTHADLDAYAAAHSVDLTGATTKAATLDAIKKAAAGSSS